MLYSFVTLAGEVTIVNARASKTAAHTYHFEVTLEHTDAGWNHYADQWQVLTPEYKVLGTRTLAHPHGKQPFTRGLEGVRVPAGLSSVIVRARDNVHGVSSREFELELP